MNSANAAIVNHLELIANLFLKAKDQWRSRAFSRVAGEIQVMEHPVEFIDGKLMTNIPGVGKAIKDVIEQFNATGTSDKLQKVRAKVPDGKVVDRISAQTAKKYVDQLLAPLTKLDVDWGYAGSMRRGSPTVKDVDVIVTLNHEHYDRQAVSTVLADAGLSADVRDGQEKVGVTITTKRGLKFTLDLNFTVSESRGAMYLYFTGPKAFNIRMRQDAKSQGLRLNQKGLFDCEGENLASETEGDIFDKLGWQYLPPNKRA